MKETRLWREYLAPHLARAGEFQKISDRFTPGVSDVLGVQRPEGRACAFELKEFYTRNGLVVADFRPGQIPFLSAWGASGALALVIGSLERELAAFGWRDAQALADGLPNLRRALAVAPAADAKDLVARLLALPSAACAYGPRATAAQPFQGPLPRRLRRDPRSV